VGPRAGLNVVTRENPSPCWESKPVRSARSLVTVLTELQRLPGVDGRIILKRILEISM